MIEKYQLKSMLKLFRGIARQEVGLGVSIRFVTTVSSGCWPKDRDMVVNSNQKFEQVIYDFFHELSHIKNLMDGKYVTYNNIGKTYRTTYKVATNAIKNGLKAEKYADKTAQKLIKKYVGRKLKAHNYSDPEVVEIYKEEHLEYFKQWLEDKGYR